MKTYNFNSVVETLAPVIANKNDYRAIINYTNGDTVLLDFSACGIPFANNEVMSWSYQRDLYEDGEWRGTDEVDAGVVYSYDEAFRFVQALLHQVGYQVKEFYYETF